MSNPDKWVILELSWRGEKIDVDDMRESLENRLDDGIEYFIPSSTFRKEINDDQVTVSLMEGYIFVEGGHSPSTYYDLEDLSYVSKVLTQKIGRERTLLHADHSEVQTLKQKLKEEFTTTFEEGDQVVVQDGVWENLEGEVLGRVDEENLTEGEKESHDERIYVKIQDIQSIDSIVTLPKAFLEKRED
jgi:transcription antitermination factor NusG